MAFAATESVNYKCPACDGALRYDGATGRLVCDFCDSTFEVQEIERLYGAQQAQADAMAQARSAAPAVSADDVTAYTCSSCGAELVCEPTTVITECPYCGNPAVVPGRVTPGFSPDFVAPFKLEKKAAKEALKRHYEGKFLLPKSFSAENRVEKIQGVYVPFWLYDAQAVGDAEFEGRKVTRVPSQKQGEPDRRIVDHYRVLRSGTMGFERVPVDGSSKMPDGHMDAIEPFDYSALVPFSLAYLPGYAADHYDQSAEECKARAEDRVKTSVREALHNAAARDYDELSDRSCTVNVAWQRPAYAMLPVWMLSTNWNGEHYLFAMNGQTGRLVGDLPIDKAKQRATCLIVFALALLAVAAAALGLGFVESPAAALGAGLVAAAIVTLIVNSVLTGQMHTAVKARSASRYSHNDSIYLTQRYDQFTHRTEE